MTADTTQFATSEARKAQDTRRANVAPLLAVGMSVRAISAETGIPVGAVHRAKRQLEKIVARGGQKAAAISRQLPTSYVMKQEIGGVPQDVRRLTVAVFERFRGQRNRAQAFRSRGLRRAVDRRQRLVRWHVR